MKPTVTVDLDYYLKLKEERDILSKELKDNEIIVSRPNYYGTSLGLSIMSHNEVYEILSNMVNEQKDLNVELREKNQKLEKTIRIQKEALDKKKWWKIF